MPPDVQQFIDNNFPKIFAFAFIWCVAGFTFTWFRMKKNGVDFPSKSTVIIEFEEKMASGFSHKSTLTKLGGAKNCLNITVTDNELWINPQFPFNLVGYYHDGIHRIQKNNISNITSKHRNVTLEFVNTDGSKGKFEIMLRNKDKFLKSLKVNS